MSTRRDIGRRIAILVVAVTAGILAFVLLTVLLDTRPAPKPPILLRPRGRGP